MASVKFNESFLHMDVLCVSRYLNYTLAGIGSNLFVYANETLLLSLPIFIGERIHSIYIKNDLILLKGGRQLSLVKFRETSDQFECQIVSKIQSSDWVQDVIMFENHLAGLVTAHNFFEFWNLETRKQLNSSSCEEKCMLYSCKIIGNALENLVIFGGTVFGDVLIWAPFLKENPILKRFRAHNGAVFSVDAQSGNKLLTTTSDDRSLKIWSVVSPQSFLHPNDWKDSTILLIHTLFGHTARVWKSMILPDYYLTIGEDSQMVVWSSDGRMIKALCLHQESGIRALHYSGETNMITTGGEDGGINVLSLNHLVIENQTLKIFQLGQNVSAKVCFTKSGFLYTSNGSCILLSDANEEIVYENENFSSYCILAVFSGGEYIVMGSIKGHLVIIDSNTKAVVVEEQITNGRIYSIHSVGRFLIICGPEGRIGIWELTDGGFKNTGKMILPHCKERWTTCAALHNEKLILGDRMGNVHIYELYGRENPVKTFRKIHSYLGVTDIMIIDDICFSIGRDGTLKKVTDSFIHLNTCKLPLEWPWKIVKYKNEILILGFRSVSFVVWSTKEREVIASHDCGGGHRSCDYKIHNNILSFLYVKEKKVFVVNLILDGIIRIRSGFHGKEINCLKVLQSRPTCVIVTGSEDTTLRISTIEKSDVRQIEVLQTHISSVRALCVSHFDTKLMIVSAGGKGQFVVWDFDLISLKCHELINHYLRKETQNWKSSALLIDPQTRIMCADILKQKNEFLIYIGCSDCQIRIFSYKGMLNELCVIPYSHCLLNLAIVEVNLMRVLVSMGTDGKVVFWEITDFSSVRQLERFSIHQLGINSFHFEKIESGKFILATGGDDNLISVAFVEIGQSKIKLRQLWASKTTHSCQITGIKILKNLLISTSTDQRITVWKWDWQKDEFKIEFLNQCMTAVPDIKGMDVVSLDNSTVLIVVHGKGMEILHMNINSLDVEKS